MRGGDQSYLGVQLAAWNITKDTSSKIFSCNLFEITHKFYPARGTTTSFPLNYRVCCAVIRRQ